MRSGVIRTRGLNGNVITAAGLIIAASMYGLVFANLGSSSSGAFVLRPGLLDTFLVRVPLPCPPLPCRLGRRAIGCREAGGAWWPPLADAVAVPSRPNVSRCCPRKKKAMPPATI